MLHYYAIPLLATSAHARPNGAPVGACTNDPPMSPTHGADEQQIETAKHMLEFAMSDQDGKYMVTLGPKEGMSDTFKGFLVHAAMSEGEATPLG